MLTPVSYDLARLSYQVQSSTQLSEEVINGFLVRRNSSCIRQSLGCTQCESGLPSHEIFIPPPASMTFFKRMASACFVYNGICHSHYSLPSKTKSPVSHRNTILCQSCFLFSCEKGRRTRDQAYN